MLDGWTKSEALCYIAHIWAEKENDEDMGDLQDFDFIDMAIAAEQFIDSYPENFNGISFTTHIENCFDVLMREIAGADTPEWTPEHFKSYY